MLDFNECVDGFNDCSLKNAECVNTFGSFECVCEPGLVLYNNSCHGEFE